MADFSNAYDKVMETAKVLGLSLQGRSIGELEWIIGGILWAKEGDFKKKAIDVHIRKAYKELSPDKSLWDLVELMKFYWEEYQKLKLPFPEVSFHESV